MPRLPQARPRVEVTDCGLYARFGSSRPVARTLVLSPWPLVAVDLDRHGRVVGIEAVPASAKTASDNPMSGAR